MDRLVFANLVERPLRAATSVAGVALGIVLILVVSGLARGMLRSTGEREGNVGAEILFQPPGNLGTGWTGTALLLPVAYTEVVSRVPGVQATTPVGRYVRSGAGGIGFELVEGVAFEAGPGYASYPEVTGLRMVQGRPPEKGRFELVVDRQREHDQGSGIGSTVELFGRRFTVAGVYEPEIGARIKMPLDVLQTLLGAENRCSWILVKTDSPEIQGEVAGRIAAEFPGNTILFTRDIPSFFERSIPSLPIFLDVVLGLAVVVSTLVVLLAMYTAVTSRAREIGILKSLGASKAFIVTVIEKEALLISLLGAVLGFLLSLAVAAGINHWSSLIVKLELRWVLTASAVALIAGGLGALYPAVKAARQDPVEALSRD